MTASSALGWKTPARPTHPTDAAPGPEARYEATEATSLAFITALPVLPPRHRAALILRDVVGSPTGQVAGILDSSEDSARPPSTRSSPCSP